MRQAPAMRALHAAILTLPIFLLPLPLLLWRSSPGLRRQPAVSALESTAPTMAARLAEAEAVLRESERALLDAEREVHAARAAEPRPPPAFRSLPGGAAAPGTEPMPSAATASPDAAVPKARSVHQAASPASEGHATPSSPRACAKGCEERGNCNRDLGRCDCPPLTAGPACADTAVPSCREQWGLRLPMPPCQVRLAHRRIARAPPVTRGRHVAGVDGGVGGLEGLPDRLRLPRRVPHPQLQARVRAGLRQRVPPTARSEHRKGLIRRLPRPLRRWEVDAPSVSAPPQTRACPAVPGVSPPSSSLPLAPAAPQLFKGQPSRQHVCARRDEPAPCS